MGKLFDVSLVFSSIPELLTKLPITLELAVVSMLIGLGLGLVMAIIKMKKIRVLTQITKSSDFTAPAARRSSYSCTLRSLVFP